MHGQDIRTNALSLALERPASPWMLALIAFATTAFFIGGQLLNLPVLALAVLPLGAALALFVNRSSTTSLYAFLCTAFGITFRPISSPGTDPVDILAGGIMCLIILGATIRLVYVERDTVTYNVPQLLGTLYLLWGLLTGLGGIIWWNNSWNDWLREFLLQSPLFILPVLYVRGIEADSKQERRIQQFFFGTSLVLMVFSVIKYAYVVSSSVYAYQIGRASVDVSTAIIVLLASLALTLHGERWIKMPYRIALSIFCVGTLVLSGYRTLWVASVLGMCILFVLVPRKQWSAGIKYLLVLGGLLLTIGAVLYVTVPLFKVFVMMTFQRLLTTTEMTTDPSLVNRFVETEIVKNYIAQSPITGYGFGARFQLFDWLLGYSYDSGFSHNGYYFVMFKTGIVGFALIYSAYAWFMYKALRLARDITEPSRVRAMAGVAFCYLAIIAISNLTLNAFGDRNGMIWVGIFWGFILSREIARKRRESLQLAAANE